MEYRKDKQLLDYNERMSILVQKVVGQQYGKYYFPACAIVGFSRNSYCWNSKIKPEDGMLRMVVGLGTRAVDRVGDDYPRMVSLSQPLLRPETSVAQKIKYSQRYIDVLNLETKKIETHHFVDLINELRDAGHHFPIRDMISVLQHGELKPPMFIPDRLEYDNCAITFDGLLSKPEFPKLMRHVLQTVEKGYNMPVDMEFVYHDSKLYPVQCRHLAMRDMEIRGAGNLLGAQQHGFIEEIGFDLYCRLLDEAVAEARGSAPALAQAPVQIDVDGDRFDLLVVSGDVLYDLRLQTRATVWVGTGLAILHRDLDLPHGRDDSETDLGLDLLAGVGFETSSGLQPYAQAKVVLSDDSSAAVVLGLRF